MTGAFGAWVLILEVAAKMPQKGLLVDKDGPLDAEALAWKTGGVEARLIACTR